MNQLKVILLSSAIVIAAAQQNFQSDPVSYATDTFQRLLANDELQCLPRLLCEQLAGGKPGQLRGFQIDTPSLFTLMKYLGLEGSKSPMLKMGEAILAGLSNKGDQYSCYSKYPNCPRDQVRLLHYLNNHRGGFFRGFSNPYYGRSESRIVNKNLEYLQQLGFQTNNFEHTRDEQKQFDNNFIFPIRKPKNFNFQPANPTDRLPSKFQFPQSHNENDFFVSKGSNFFPQ